ncbi:hypothetical protein CQW23_08140 [Capsicum baccatum]|uniref:Uncharacterized protein n=1 Tax=Capsicum baccatum TaxID=33114 RepID=A0A2G2X864_CAPBA|nr:hypothetical protein CQW23_08140 [Capsicum baccatum]
MKFSHIIHLTDIKLYQRLDPAIATILLHLKDVCGDQFYAIIERTTDQLQRLITSRDMSGACVNVALEINHICDGEILLASEELSMDGMIPASKSSIGMLEPMEPHEINMNDECMQLADHPVKTVARLDVSRTWFSDKCSSKRTTPPGACSLGLNLRYYHFGSLQCNSAGFILKRSLHDMDYKILKWSRRHRFMHESVDFLCSEKYVEFHMPKIIWEDHKRECSFGCQISQHTSHLELECDSKICILGWWSHGDFATILMLSFFYAELIILKTMFAADPDAEWHSGSF